MSKIKIYNLDGKEVSEADLDASVFGVKANDELVSQAVRVQRARARHAIAHTKTRGEVSGGGKKPWKQKGTGNARAGSSRSPLWSGGGITFGPRNTRNYSLCLNVKAKRAALRVALSEIAQENKMVVVNDLAMKEISTKNFVSILEKLPIKEGKILIILDKVSKEVELSAANLAYVKIIKAENINVIDLLNYNFVIATTDALAKINQNLAKK